MPVPPPRPGPSVSAVIATRDRPQLLVRAVEAVLTQDYDGAIEAVVVFDQSRPDDALVTRLESLTGERRRVVVIANSRASGLAGARNTGLAAATGDYAAFCDDDDVWLPGKLQTQMDALLVAPDTWFCAGGVEIDVRGRRHRRLADARLVTLRELVSDRVTALHPSTFVFERERVVEIGGLDEALPGSYGEDYDLLLRVARESPVLALAGPLATVYWHSGSFFADRWRTIAAAHSYLRAKHPEFAGESADSAWLDGKTAFAMAASGQRGQAWRLARSVLRHKPSQKQALASLVVMAGVPAQWIQRSAQALGRGV